MSAFYTVITFYNFVTHKKLFLYQVNIIIGTLK